MIALVTIKEELIICSPLNVFEPVVANVVDLNSSTSNLLSTDVLNVFISDAIEALNATLAAVDALKSVATELLNVPPTLATLALNSVI